MGRREQDIAGLDRDRPAELFDEPICGASRRDPDLDDSAITGRLDAGVLLAESQPAEGL
jgi:hypothetical protein